MRALTVACCILAASLGSAGGCTSRLAPKPRVAEQVPSCPGYQGVDRRRLDRVVRAAGEGSSSYLDRVSVPEEAAVRPSTDARVVIKAAMPESATDPMTTRAVVWQDATGTWWYWLRTFDYSWVRQSAPNADGTVAWEPERYPPSMGALPVSTAEQVEFLLSHPCRAGDPPAWPRSTPLQSGLARQCPLDAASYLLRIQRRDGTTENISVPCDNETMTFRLIRTVLGR